MNYLKDKNITNITGSRFSQLLNIYFSLNIGLFNFALLYFVWLCTSRKRQHVEFLEYQLWITNEGLWWTIWLSYIFVYLNPLSYAPTNWAIRPWVQLALIANFQQLPQFHLNVQITFWLLPSSVTTFILTEILQR